jgi:hypothetical protein
MSLCIKKLKTTAEILKFRKLLGRQDLPMSYFDTGICYGFFWHGNLIAGYFIVHSPLDEMKSLQQIPENFSKHLGHEDPFKYLEFVGYFLNSKKYACRFKRHLAMTLLGHKASHVVYAYPSDHSQIETFCQKGNPLRLYQGKSASGDVSINVEILSKWGIFKICVFQIIQHLKRCVAGD